MKKLAFFGKATIVSAFYFLITAQTALADLAPSFEPWADSKLNPQNKIDYFAPKYILTGVVVLVVVITALILISKNRKK